MFFGTATATTAGEQGNGTDGSGGKPPDERKRSGVGVRAIRQLCNAGAGPTVSTDVVGGCSFQQQKRSRTRSEGEESRRDSAAHQLLPFHQPHPPHPIRTSS